MKKVLITVALNIIIFMAFYIVYFFEMSDSMYGVQFVPAFTPIGIALMAFIFIVLNKLILRHNLKMTILILFSAIIIFASLTTYITSKYDYVFKHFFEEKMYGSLWRINEYRNEPGNFFDVKKVVEEAGIKVTYIEKNDNFFYLINSGSGKYSGNEYFVLLNYDMNKVVNKISLKDLYDEHLEILRAKEGFKEVVSASIPGTSSLIISYRNKDDSIYFYGIESIPSASAIMFRIEDTRY